MIKVTITNADNISVRFKKLSKELKDGIQMELNAWADNVATEAKKNVAQNSSDEGNLLRSIAPRYARMTQGKGTASVVASASYAAYIEFGTRKFAAAYVPSLPDYWQDIASKAKGKSGEGDFYDFVLAIAMWVKRKGIAARYSVKTQKRLKSTKADEKRELEAAWAIAYKILKNGIRPRPFLYPAVNKYTPQVLDNIKQILK